MPKTDITKIESEDVKELFDEALDRFENAQMCLCCPPSVASSSPA